MHNSRKETLKKIFGIIRDSHPVSRKTIAERSGVSLMSVCNALETMDGLGLICETPSDGRAVGRRAGLISPCDGEYLILDMTGINFEIFLLSMSGEMLSRYLYLPRKNSDFFASLCDFTGKLTTFVKNKIKTPLAGAGILVPGRYDRGADRISGDRSGNYDNISLGTMLFDLIPCEYIEVEDDLTMGASHVLRSPSVSGDTLYIKATNPCGAAFISGGKLYCGSSPGLPGLSFDPTTADKDFVSRYFDNISLFSVADMAAKSIAAYMTLITPKMVIVEHDPLFSDTLLALKITELLRGNYLSPLTPIPELSMVKRQVSAPVEGLAAIIIDKYLDRCLDEA